MSLILRFGIGMVLFTFGIDQFRKWEPWAAYVPKWLRWVMLPNEKMFMRSHALSNIVLGLLLFSGWYLSWVSLITVVWLAMITFSTFFTDWTIAMRDLGLTAAALALYFL